MCSEDWQMILWGNGYGPSRLQLLVRNCDRFSVSKGSKNEYSFSAWAGAMPALPSSVLPVSGCSTPLHVLAGDSLNSELVAVVVPDPEALLAWAKSRSPAPTSASLDVEWGTLYCCPGC